jgi:hypothetical protein
MCSLPVRYSALRASAKDIISATVSLSTTINHLGLVNIITPHYVMHTADFGINEQNGLRVVKAQRSGRSEFAEYKWLVQSLS